MIALALALAVAGPARMSFPGGSVQIPGGCTAPAELVVLIDAWTGAVECAGGRKIVVAGGVMLAAACPAEGSVTLLTAGGAKVRICPLTRRIPATGKRIRMLVADFRGTYMSTEVRSPDDAFLLLDLATTFEPERRK